MRGLDVRAASRGQHLDGILLAVGGSAVMSFLAEDWIAGAAVLVLWAIWHYLWDDEAPPVLALALTFQWSQVVSGVLYYGVTGRRVYAMDLSNYRPMVLIGLGCVVALLLGLVTAMRLNRQNRQPERVEGRGAFRLESLVVVYVTSTLLAGTIQGIVFEFPRLGQGLQALLLLRLVVLFM